MEDVSFEVYVLKSIIRNALTIIIHTTQDGSDVAAELLILEIMTGSQVDSGAKFATNVYWSITSLTYLSALYHTGPAYTIGSQECDYGATDFGGSLVCFVR